QRLGRGSIHSVARNLQSGGRQSPESSSLSHHARIHVPPCFLPRANGSRTQGADAPRSGFAYSLVTGRVSLVSCPFLTDHRPLTTADCDGCHPYDAAVSGRQRGVRGCAATFSNGGFL